GREAERQTARSDERGWFSTTYRLRTRTNRAYVVDLISAFVPLLSHARPDEQAGRLAAVGAARGWDGLRDENRAAWKELWQGRIEVDGPGNLRQGIHQ